MSGIGLWRVSEQQPSRLASSVVQLEQDLEDWIEHAPSLLERGLTIVGRQLRTEAGPLDLLGIDPQGRWVLIEIKRERLRREVVAQAIDYASCIERIDHDVLRAHCDQYLSGRGHGTLDSLLSERACSLDEDQDRLDVVVYLVGTGVDPGLERMVGYLSDSAKMSIRVVTFSVFDDAQGGLLLAREIHETHEPEAARTPVQGLGEPTPGSEDLLKIADERGVGAVVRPIYEASLEVGLAPMPKKKSFMIAPPQNRTRCLLYVPISRAGRTREGEVKVYIAAEAFEEFYGIPEAEVIRVLGWNEYQFVDAEAAERLADTIRQLFAGEKTDSDI